MSDRTIRRAAERKALKQARKQAHQSNSSASETTASEAQLAANRANAQLAHGPTTDEGKAISSRNHTSHGLTAAPSPNYRVLPEEDQSAYDASVAAYQAEWQPATATEHDLVRRLASSAWMRDRATRFQDRIIIENAGAVMNTDTRKQFELLARYHTTHARAFSRAFSEIMRLRGFQSRLEKDAALLARRTLDLQIRFESQKRAAELHAAKLEALRLKQEAIKQRKQPAPKPEPVAQTAAQAPESSLSQTA
jgi:hypothetical protein